MNTNLLLAAIAAVGVSCSSGAAKAVEAAPTPEAAAFSADSAYAYVARQVEFGPRVPGTDAHRQCREWLVAELQRHGADTVTVQQGTVPDIGTIYNIMARFNASAHKRVLLLAHYDTRPWADEEADPALHSTPIDGANDGASGVGVLLELARQFGINSPEVGVDLLMVDGEDSGSSGNDDSWARGAAYWAENLPYKFTEPLPAYGILLDMVGGEDAVFPREMFSNHLAPAVVNKVWGTASRLKLDRRFVNRIDGAINDDHLHVNGAGIPCIDIIECANPATGSFPPTWHTLSDNLDHISAATLGDVGTVVSTLIYSEKP